MRTLSIASILAVASLLAACGGGGSGPSVSQGDIDRVESDPRTVRAASIFDEATVLLIPAGYLNLDGTIGGQATNVLLPAIGRCQGLGCTLTGYGTAQGLNFPIAASDIVILGNVVLAGRDDVTGIGLGERAGMDTGFVAGDSSISAGTLSATGTGESYGVWGEYGFASVQLMTGSVAGTYLGQPVDGAADLSVASVIGSPSLSIPSGLGSATWNGAAEAVHVASHERRFGTSTVTMADLTQPYVDVDVIIDGRSIGTSAWDGIALRSDGFFLAGISGQDAMIGAFYGPGHEEAYGGFDTGTYVGAFGAKRDE